MVAFLPHLLVEKALSSDEPPLNLWPEIQCCKGSGTLWKFVKVRCDSLLGWDFEEGMRNSLVDSQRLQPTGPYASSRDNQSLRLCRICPFFSSDGGVLMDSSFLAG